MFSDQILQRMNYIIDYIRQEIQNQERKEEELKLEIERQREQMAQLFMDIQQQRELQSQQQRGVLWHLDLNPGKINLAVIPLLLKCLPKNPPVQDRTFRQNIREYIQDVGDKVNVFYSELENML